MADSFISKRIIFPRGKQRTFILHSKNVLCFSNIEIAGLLGVSLRTLTDWKREKFSMSLRAAKTLSRMTKINIPKSAKVKEPFWYVDKGASAGGIAVYKKYGMVGGDPGLRKKKWREWWESKGKYKKHSIIGARLPFKKPIYSIKLAEFTGIVLGDGGMTKNQLKITLHCVDDLEYSEFVMKLMRELFNLMPSKHRRSDFPVFNISISRIGLIEFCTKKLGLKTGNKIKQQIDIPNWIKKDKKFKTACIRGLIDTDGSVFAHRYKSNNKYYEYKKLAFTSLSRPLFESAFNILKNIGLNPRISRNRDIWLDSVKDVEKYFNTVGSHNPKHLKRYYS